METEIYLSGGIDGWPTQSQMVKIMRAAGFSVTVGRYSIRLDDCDHFIFQEYGGDLGEPQIDADANSLETMMRDAVRVSQALTDADIRHRFELYDDANKMVGYLHHDWPQAPDA